MKARMRRNSDPQVDPQARPDESLQQTSSGNGDSRSDLRKTWPARSLLQDYWDSRDCSPVPAECSDSTVIASLLEACKTGNVVIERLPDFEGKRVVVSLLPDGGREMRVGLLHEYLCCLEILRLLDIVSVTIDVFLTCQSLCDREPFRKRFLSSKMQEAREFLLHSAVRQLLESGMFDDKAVSSLITQVRDSDMIFCISRLAAFKLKELQLPHFIRLLDETMGISFEECLDDALRHKGWTGVCNLMKMYDVSKRLLHQILARAVEFRRWELIHLCVQQGGDIATACAENGYDLNARTGNEQKTVLQDANDCPRIFGIHYHDKRDCRDMGMVEKLLQAGADPFVENTSNYFGPMLGMKAVREGDWDRVIQLLKLCKAPGDLASKRLLDGKTLLHIVCKKKKADVLDKLLSMQADPTVTDSQGNTLMMAALTSSDSEDSDPESDEQRENVLRLLVKSGVATHQTSSRSELMSLEGQKSSTATERQPLQAADQHSHSATPMGQAVGGGKLRLARMLYAAGACSYKEIHTIATSFHIRENLERNNRSDMMDFLNNISSHPRSLVDSCTLKISHLIGCGPQRDVRAASLGLPDSLRRRVLQDHVISPDFLKDCPPAPCDRRLPRSGVMPRGGFRCGYGIFEMRDSIDRSMYMDYAEKYPDCVCGEVEGENRAGGWHSPHALPFL